MKKPIKTTFSAESQYKLHGENALAKIKSQYGNVKFMGSKEHKDTLEQIKASNTYLTSKGKRALAGSSKILKSGSELFQKQMSAQAPIKKPVYNEEFSFKEHGAKALDTLKKRSGDTTFIGSKEHWKTLEQIHSTNKYLTSRGQSPLNDASDMVKNHTAMFEQNRKETALRVKKEQRKNFLKRSVPNALGYGLSNAARSMYVK